MQIPIENIYYLLCYAWNKLDEKDKVEVSATDYTTVLDLFAKILVNGTKILLKRGIDKNYIEHTEEIAGVKGKLQFSETVKRSLLLQQKTVCEFDEFSTNIVMNRILATTINKLIRTKELDKQLKIELKSLQRMLAGIAFIEIKSSLFRQYKLNRNNRFYGFIMNVCQIIFENTLPSEEPGKYKFSDFTRDDNKMNQLFEAFIRNFYNLEQKKFIIVGSEMISWKFDYADASAIDYLPKMKTDITLEHDKEKVIIDTKFYRETMTLNYDKEKIKSANLYQLFSYLLNQEDGSSKTMNATGILLYPTIAKDYNLQFKYANHNIYIRTVNLNTNWKNISSRLKLIIQVDDYNQ